MARLAGAEAEKAALVAKHEAVVAFLDHAALSGPMAMLAMRNVRSLAAEQAAAETRRAAMTTLRQDAGVRVKLAQRVAAPILQQERESAERRTLEQLIEAAVQREVGE